MGTRKEKGAEMTTLSAPFTGTFEGHLLILMLGRIVSTKNEKVRPRKRKGRMRKHPRLIRQGTEARPARERVVVIDD
jgi:hypothetical protein